MRRLIPAMLLLLVAQCLVAIALYWPESPRREGEFRAPFAPFAAADVQRIHIGDEFDNEAELVRAGEHWMLPALEGLPADPDKVEALLAAITRQKQAWPVAESAAARQRFQVADYFYQRRLELAGSEGALGVFYLGTSPGFRKVHARNASQSAIYSIPFNTYDAPATSGAWLDGRLLEVRAPVAITADGYSLRLQDGEWRAGTGNTPHPAELEALLDTLRNLRVKGVAAPDRQRELSRAEAALQFAIEGLGGERTLEMFATDDGHFVHSSEYPYFFKLGAYDFDRLAGVDLRRISGARINP